MGTKKALLGLGLSVALGILPQMTIGAENELIVRMRDSQSSATTALKSLSLKSAKAALVSESEGLIRITLPSAAAAKVAARALEKMSDVLSVAPNLMYRPALHLQMRKAPMVMTSAYEPLAMPIPAVQLPPTQRRGEDVLTAKDWAMKNIGLEGLPFMKAAGTITAAVIDTGVDYNHEDLIAAMWRKPGDELEVGYDFAQDSKKPFDRKHFDLEGCFKDYACRIGHNQDKFFVNPGHGTHCAGHVGAVGKNAIGIRGVGTGVQIMALKFFYDVGHKNAGQGDDAAAIQSIDYAIKNGAKIINASWGGRQHRSAAEKSELKKALLRARDAGVLVVAAAGNDANDQEAVEDPIFPAAYNLDNLIVVAATDRNDELGSFSTYGAKSVHIGAPGVKILSTTVGSLYSDLVAEYVDGNGEKTTMDWNGTSMAAPIVAGAAALIWTQYPHADYREIRQRILSNARPVPALAGKVSTGGVLDIAAALR